MRTREIPAGEWASFLEGLSEQAGDRPVDVRIEGPDIGDQALATNMPLIGITCAEQGAYGDAIALTVAGAPGKGKLTHLIDGPEHLWVQEDDAGRVAVLDIEDRARVKTLVFFPAGAPEG